MMILETVNTGLLEKAFFKLGKTSEVAWDSSTRFVCSSKAFQTLDSHCFAGSAAEPHHSLKLYERFSRLCDVRVGKHDIRAVILCKLEVFSEKVAVFMLFS